MSLVHDKNQNTLRCQSEPFVFAQDKLKSKTLETLILIAFRKLRFYLQIKIYFHFR
jgi:hypothetical protein